MSARRFSRLQKATALVPLAILSAAWTANMANLMPDPTAMAVSNKTPSPATLPDGSALPTAPLKAPASITSPHDHSQPAGTKGSGHGDPITSVSATGIPATALAAYQRATTVINDADKSCHLDWPLLAAIGRVESNHGRVGGSRLTTAGIATPAILGPALTGRHGTSRVADTDGGAYDGNRNVDRAVGPMQFIPSTWAIVGVDGDGDGKRNPQDINDAALATAVYLCSGSNLSSLAGQRAAVYRYNHSHPYVATVLGVAAAYRAGDYTSAPTDVVPAGDLIVPTPNPVAARPHGQKGARDHSPAHPLASGHGTAAVHGDRPPAAADGKAHDAGTPSTPADSSNTSAPATHPTTGSTPSDPPSQPATPPAAPVISSPVAGSTLADSTPVISGTGKAGATVTVTITPEDTDAEAVTATAIVHNGSWSLTAPDVADGDYTVSAVQKDTDGTVSEASAAVAFTVDTTALAPKIAATPTEGNISIRGTGEPGATVSVLVNGVAHGTASVGDDGTWTAELDAPLAAGDSVTATQTDAVGNTSPASQPVAAAATDPPSADPPSAEPSPQQ